MAKKAKKGDARTIRSKKELSLSLELLLQEKDFVDISIKEIAERAMVSKNTFYNNFDTKEELLDQLFLRYLDNIKVAEIFDEGRTTMERVNIFNSLCTRFLSEHYAKFHSMVLHDESRSIYWALANKLQIIIRDELRIYGKGLTDAEHNEMESTFFAGGCAHLVYREFAKDPSQCSEEGLRELLNTLWERLLAK